MRQFLSSNSDFLLNVLSKNVYFKKSLFELPALSNNTLLYSLNNPFHRHKQHTIDWIMSKEVLKSTSFKNSDTRKYIYLGISLLGKSFCKDLDKVKTDVKLLLDIVFFFHIKSLCTQNLPYNSSEGSKFKVTFTKNKMKAK